MVDGVAVRSVGCVPHRVFFRKSWELTLYDLLVCSGDKLGGPRDSMGYIDNMPRPKPTRHGTCKYKKFGTARRSAPAGTPADTADPTVARAPSSTATTARDAQHGTVRTSARTTNAPMTATPSAHGVARTSPSTAARGRRNDLWPSVRRPPCAALAHAGRAASQRWWPQRTRADARTPVAPRMARCRRAQPERHARACGPACDRMRARASSARRVARRRRARATSGATCDNGSVSSRSALSAEPPRSGWHAGQRKEEGAREACTRVQQCTDSVLGRAFVRGSGNAPTSLERRSEDVVGQARRPAHRGAAPRCLQSQTEGRDLVRAPSVCEVGCTMEHRMMARGAANRY